MADFTPIMTQEDFDAAIAARLTREREKAVRPYADYEQIKTELGSTKETLAARVAEIAELTGQLKGARTDLAKTRIALDKGLPLALAQRLTGETEDELKADAETLAGLLGKGRTVEPARGTEREKGMSGGAVVNGISQGGLRAMLDDLNLQGG